MDDWTPEERALCEQAMRIWLTTLVDEASWHGRGWYHFADGEVIVAAIVNIEKEM